MCFPNLSSDYISSMRLRKMLRGATGYKDWMVHWVYLSNTPPYFTSFEPDNNSIYQGNDPVRAVHALANSTYDG